MLAHIQECNIKLYRNGTAVAYVLPTGRTKHDLTQIAQRRRTYKKKRRNIISAACGLWEKKRKCLMFITFTFAFDVNEIDANNIFTKFLKNLHTNYELKNYVWVKERQKNNRLHYHLLCDGRFIHPKIMQRSFNNAVVHYDSSYVISSNSVRYGREVIIKDVTRLAKYVSKYAGKCTDEVYERPAYAISNGIADFSREITFNELEAIVKKYGKYRIIELNYSMIILLNYIDVKKFRKKLEFSP